MRYAGTCTGRKGNSRCADRGDAQGGPRPAAALFNRHAADLGLDEITIYLADLRQDTLVAMPEGAQRPSQRLSVDDSSAGLAYRTGQMRTQESRTSGLELWLPLIDG